MLAEHIVFFDNQSIPQRNQSTLLSCAEAYPKLEQSNYSGMQLHVTHPSSVQPQCSAVPAVVKALVTPETQAAIASLIFTTI